MVSLVFRLATLDDAPRVRELTENAFSTNDSRPDWTGDAEFAAHFTISLETVQKDLSTPGLLTFVATNKQDYIIASFNMAKTADGTTARLGMLVVQDEYQRGGVGRQVLDHFEDYSRRVWGIERFSLGALSSRKALLAWYQRRGYRDVGKRTPFPRESMSSAGVIVPEDLCFIEMIKEPEVVDGNEPTKS